MALNAIERTEAAALIQEQPIAEIVQTATETSAALRTFRKVNMGTSIATLPVISALPVAGFITGDVGVKPTTEAAWEKKVLTAEELAVIVAIPENVFDDSSVNIWNEVRPRIAEAFAVALDAAVFFGTGAPASWPDSLAEGAIAAGNTASAAGAGDLVEDINQTWKKVEDDGFDVNVTYGPRALRSSLRGLRDTTGQPLLAVVGGLGSAPSYTIYGEDLEFVSTAAWRSPPTAAPSAVVIAGDRNMAILGIRQDATYKLLDQATVGGISLAETDQIALRCKMRVAFQVADPSTLSGGATAYPFAALVA